MNLWKAFGADVRGGSPLARFAGGAVALLIVVLAGAVAWAIFAGANCLRWEETGGMTCVEIADGISNCTPNRECVEWRDE